MPAFPEERKSKPLEIKPATDYRVHQTILGVTVAADLFVEDSKAKPVFDGVNPYRYGVIPLLLVIENKTDQTVDTREMEARLILPNNEIVYAVDPKDVPRLRPPDRPDLRPPSPSPIPGLGRRNRNPLDIWEITGRALVAKMIPPGERAAGFLYFNTHLQPGTVLFIRGLRNTRSGQELFYYELPLDPAIPDRAP